MGHADGKTYHRRREPCCEDEARRYLATLDAARPSGLDVERLREAWKDHDGKYDEEDHGHDCVAEIAAEYAALDGRQEEG